MLAPPFVSSKDFDMCKPASHCNPLAASVIALTMGLSAPGIAAEPTDSAVAPGMASAAAAGFYAMKLGAYTVVALSDGVFDLSSDPLLIETRPGQAKALLDRAHLPAAIPTTVNAYLIDTGSRRILVDAGAGALQGPGLGKMQAHLAAAGYPPQSIDDILLTHLHPDHVGGITNGDRAVFPNAIVHVEAREAQFWLDASNVAKVDASVQAAFDGAVASLKPYIRSGRMKTFRAGQAPITGIGSVDAHGHTAGHVAYRVQSRGETLLLWGDLLHVAAVQFPAPAVTIRYDSAPAAAKASRERAFADAAKRGYWVAAAHVAFPGIGRLRHDAHGYVWKPAAAASP